MWQAITYVTSGLTLAAFIGAVIAAITLNQSRKLERQLKSADTDKKADIIRSTVLPFEVDVSTLSSQQRYNIVLRQLEMKSRQFRAYVLLAVLASLLFAAFAFYSVSRQISELAQEPKISELDVRQSSVSSCTEGRAVVADGVKVASIHAKFLSDPNVKFSLNWVGDLATDVAENATSRITDAYADGDLLVIRYNWQAGMIAIKPISGGGTVPFIRYQGAWVQNNGAGCIDLRLPLAEIWDAALRESGETGDSFARGVWYDGENTQTGSSIALNQV